MNPNKYKQWVADLSLLTQEQLVDLSARIKMLSNANNTEPSGKQDFGSRVLQAVIAVFRKNRTELPSIVTLRKSPAYKSAKDKIQDLQAFIEPLSKSRLAQDQILKEGIFLLYNDLCQWKGAAISSHLVISQIHRVPASLNKAFPGYAASGLLEKIVGQKIDGQVR